MYTPEQIKELSLDDVNKELYLVRRMELSDQSVTDFSDEETDIVKKYIQRLKIRKMLAKIEYGNWKMAL